MQRLSSVCVALLLSVFVLAIPAGGYAVIVEFKYRLFLLICGGYCLAVLVLRSQLALVNGERLHVRWANVKKMTAMLLLIGYMLFTVASAVLSGFPGVMVGRFRYDGVLTIGIYVLTCYFMSLYLQPKKWMLFLLGGSTSLLCLLAMIQLTGANPFSLYPPGLNFFGANIYYSGYFIGTLGNAGLVGAFLSLVSGILAMTLIKYAFAYKWLLGIPLFLSAFIIFEMGVDAAALALGAGFLLMLPMAVTCRASLSRTCVAASIIVAAFAMAQTIVFGIYTAFRVDALLFVIPAAVLLLCARISQTKPVTHVAVKKYRLWAAGFVLLAISASVLYLWFFGSHHGGMAYEASQILRGRWDDTFGTRRVFIWRVVLEGIRPEHLLFGTGPDTLGFWGLEPFYQFVSAADRVLFAQVDAAHNVYLHILATQGLLALLCYLGLLGYAAAKWINNPGNQTTAVAGAGVLFYAIQALFGISMPIVTPLLWVCLGICISKREEN